jgi:phosphoglycerate dehydrogenase-like enzyme
VAGGASSRRLHRFGNVRAGSVRARERLPPAAQARGPFIAEVGIVTSGEALGMRVGFVGVGRMGQPVCANLVRAGYAVTAGDVRAELESMVAEWGARWGGAASTT